MLGYIAADGCRMEYLRRELDDSDAAPCGRCDNCTGRSWSADVPEAGATAARERLRRPGVDVEPRRMWPTGMKELGLTVSGKIAAGQLAEPGRALGRLTDIGWGSTLRALLAGPDQPVPPAVLDAVVQVLTAWNWAQRPAGVMTIGSSTHPVLIQSLGEAIARVGRLPYLGTLRYRADGPGPRRHNSAQRLASLWTAFAPPADLTNPHPASTDPAGTDPAGPVVLLVDDQIDSGWTMTVAAKLLREAGAAAVLPLALAVTAG